MMLPRVWVYNYDFEFELAGEPRQVDSGVGFLPWYFLNRSWHTLLPLASENDTIMVYETPLAGLLEGISESRLPRFRLIAARQESNSVFADLTAAAELNLPAEHELCPWGWSRKAFQIAEKMPSRTVAANTHETIRHWNAKTTSHRLRQELLAISFRIPGVIVKSADLQVDGLEPAVAEFVGCNGPAWIKHPFGTAGRLSDRQDNITISARKVGRWENWLRKTGEILLEKQVTVRQEWSLQVQFESAGQVKPVGLTRLYSGPGGNYSGTLLSESDQVWVARHMEGLAPILDRLRNSGYAGPAGFDLIESSDGSFRLLEINARLTMGRTALEWHRRLSGFQVSYFTNLFMTISGSASEQALLESVQRIVRSDKVRITILNLVLAPSGKNAMLSILVQGHNIDSVLTETASVRSEIRRL